ncbi:MAG: hypothetical protein PVG19_02055 [Desulfobacterales bacterium]|jgi:hypothetical protein
MTALYDTHDDLTSAFTFGKASVEPENSMETSDFTASFQSDTEEEEVQFQGRSIGMYDDPVSYRNKFYTKFNIKMPVSILILVGVLSLVYYAL